MTLIQGVVTKVVAGWGAGCWSTITYADAFGEQNITGRMFPAVRPGDTIAVEYRPEDEAVVTVVGKAVEVAER